MRTVRIDLDRQPPLNIRGEKIVTQIAADVSHFLREYPNGTPEMLYHRPGDATPYPLVCSIDEEHELVTAILTALETEKPGTVHIQVNWRAGEALKKSPIYRGWVDDDIGGAGDPPAPRPEWVEDVLETGAYVFEALPGAIDTALAEAKASGEFDGEDGFSPTVRVAEIEGGHRIIITDASGDHTFDVMDGQDGGTGDHTQLINRDVQNQHPIEAIEGLVAALGGKGTYSKPIGGIPASDLSSAVNSALDDAATAVQPGDLADVATSGDYDDLSNKPTIPEAYDDTAIKNRLAAIEAQEETWNDKQDAISDLTDIRNGAAAGATAIQTETDPTVPAWAKNATKPTYDAEEIEYDPDETHTAGSVAAELAQQSSEIASQSTAIATKLTEPSSGLEVGKYFKIASIDENGHAVLEAVDLPIASLSKLGVVRTNETWGTKLGNANTGELCLAKATDAELTAKSNQWKPVVPSSLDYAVRAGLLSNTQITDADKSDILKTIGADTVTTSTAASVTLKNRDTTVMTNTPTSLTVNLPTPTAGYEYITGLIFTAGTGFTMTENIDGAYDIVGDTPTWTAGHTYEISYRCLWVSNTNGIIISAKYDELSN